MAGLPGGSHPLDRAVVRQVVECAAASGRKAYLVGGYLRDALSGRRRQPCDFDFAVAGGDAVALARLVASRLDGHFVLLDEAFDTARVVLADGTMIDLAGCLGGDISADLRRRDFTVNALAWDPDEPDSLLDPLGGVEDIEARMVRAVAEENFLDDPLRMLRAFRICATIGGEIAAATLSMIRAHASAMRASAPERIAYELFLVAESCQAASLLKQMGDVGLLEVIFPELTATRAVTANAYHHLGLWDHSLECVAQLDLSLPAMPDWVRADLAGEAASGVTRLAATRIAALLHDIGKPSTWKIVEGDRHTFYGHDRVGAEMLEETSRRLRFSRSLERLMVKLVRWHLRPGQLFHQGRPTDRAVHRFYRAIGEDVPPLMVLAFGDLGATRGPGLAGPARESLKDDLTALLLNYAAFREMSAAQGRLLTGNDVMSLIGIGPGPVLGELLAALEEAQGLGEVQDRKQAESFIIETYRCLKETN